LFVLHYFLVHIVSRFPKGEGGILFYVCPSVQDIFLSICWWQKSNIWSQASYRYTILWVAFLDPSDFYFLFTDLVGFYSDEKCACMLNVYKNQQNRETGSRNLMGPKTLPTIWGTYMKLVTKYQISAINSWYLVTSFI
jgi:hypothetical protein